VSPPDPPPPVRRGRRRPSATHLRLFGAVAALVLAVVAISGFFAERALRERELARVGATLEEQAALVRELVRGIPLQTAEAARLDGIADRAGAASGIRVTLISSEGALVGDSEVPLERLAGIENHALRPEVRAALTGRSGRGMRQSSTVGRSLLYVSLPAGEPGGGAIRVAAELSHLDEALADLRRSLALAGAVGVAAALALAYAVSWLALRPLRELRGLTLALAAGDLEYRIPRRFADELGEIADAIRTLAERLRERVDQVTREKEQLRAVLDGMVEGVLVVDESNRIVLANDRVAEFYGARPPLEGRSVLAALRDAELDELLAEAARTDDPVSRTREIVHPARRTVSVQVARFPAPPGRRLGSVVVLHDVSDVARVETMRREFVANASHELRTPLAAIRGFAETLLGDISLSEEQRRSYIEVIDRHAKRLGTLVNDLLELSRIESGQAPLEFQPVDVAAIATGLLRDCEPRLAERRLEADSEVDGPGVAWADPQAVWQILSNLLDNAIKYTEPGGRICIRIHGDARKVSTLVSDTGSGIPERDLARIFERFYRVDRARSRALGGTGLGLSIVKHLVQSQGGEITVESELGRGSTFRFTLPRAKPHGVTAETARLAGTR
jgi:two-component system phosphate regulon sensor histidine kinase PhoR